MFVRAFRLACLMAALMLLSAGVGAAGAAPARPISGHLTKTTFTAAQAGSVKLIYTIPKTSRTFGYSLQVKNGAKYKIVAQTKKKGAFKGQKTMTVKQLFAGRPVKVGSYRVILSCDKGRLTLLFTIVSKSTPGGTPGQGGTGDAGRWVKEYQGTFKETFTSSQPGSSASGSAQGTIRLVSREMNHWWFDAYGSGSSQSEETLELYVGCTRYSKTTFTFNITPITPVVQSDSFLGLTPERSTGTVHGTGYLEGYGDEARYADDCGISGTSTETTERMVFQFGETGLESDPSTVVGHGSYPPDTINMSYDIHTSLSVTHYEYSLKATAYWPAGSGSGSVWSGTGPYS